MQPLCCFHHSDWVQQCGKAYIVWLETVQDLQFCTSLVMPLHQLLNWIATWWSNKLCHYGAGTLWLSQCRLGLGCPCKMWNFFAMSKSLPLPCHPDCTVLVFVFNFSASFYLPSSIFCILLSVCYCTGCITIENIFSNKWVQLVSRELTPRASLEPHSVHRTPFPMRPPGTLHIVSLKIAKTSPFCWASP